MNSKNNDTFQFEAILQLRELYEKGSKHSNYQILPRQLQSYFPNNDLNIKSRYEKERLDFIIEILDFKDKKVMDIGGNTGYFTFELLNTGAASVIYYEGNVNHAAFVQKACHLLGINDRIKVKNEYFNFSERESGRAGEQESIDICLLLNVLHHVGDDYGDNELSIQNARQEIKRSLQVMVEYTNTLVFQLGFCWKGDRSRGLFPNGTKLELIDFVKDAVKEHWNVRIISIPENIDDKIIYAPFSSSNSERRDDLGEFLNRPLFVLDKC